MIFIHKVGIVMLCLSSYVMLPDLIAKIYSRSKDKQEIQII